jgi:ribonuclease BN (tRNA processing enzyme)
MRVTVLGKSPSWADRDGACSGYLASVGELALLIDCGSGVFAKLRREVAYETVGAIVISHLHADHVLDLIPFAYALTYGPTRPAERPRLHVPPGGRATLRALSGLWGGERLIEDAFELDEYDVDGELALGAARLRFCRVPHYIPSHAIELCEHAAATRLVFSADCGPNDALTRFAQAADLLFIESTLLEPEGVEPAGHLSAAQAGAIGRAAGVARLVLTHFSDQLDASLLAARAQAAFGAEVELAAEGARYEL